MRDAITGAKSGEVKIILKDEPFLQVIPHNFGPHLIDFSLGGVVLGNDPIVLNLVNVFGASVSRHPNQPDVKIPGISSFSIILKMVEFHQLDVRVVDGKHIDNGTIIEDRGIHKVLFSTPKPMNVHVNFYLKSNGNHIQGSPLPLAITSYKINLLNNPKIQF